MQICWRWETGDVLREAAPELMGAELLIMFVYGVLLVELYEEAIARN